MKQREIDVFGLSFAVHVRSSLPQSAELISMNTTQQCKADKGKTFFDMILQNLTFCEKYAHFYVKLSSSVKKSYIHTRDLQKSAFDTDYEHSIFIVVTQKEACQKHASFSYSVNFIKNLKGITQYCLVLVTSNPICVWMKIVKKKRKLLRIFKLSSLILCFETLV